MLMSMPHTLILSMVIIRVDGNCLPASVFFKIRRTTPMRKMMEAYCTRCSQSLECCSFVFNSSLILPEQTAEQLDMREGSKVVCTITPDSAETLALLAKKAKPTRIDSSKLVVENHGLYECMICAHVYWPPVLCSDGHTMCQGTGLLVTFPPPRPSCLSFNPMRPDFLSCHESVLLWARGRHLCTFRCRDGVAPSVGCSTMTCLPRVLSCLFTACAKKLHDRDQPCPMRCNSKLSSKPAQNFELRRVVERLKASCTSTNCPVAFLFLFSSVQYSTNTSSTRNSQMRY